MGEYGFLCGCMVCEGQDDGLNSYGVKFDDAELGGWSLVQVLEQYVITF